MTLKLGTRGSRLALVQADRVCTMLRAEGIDVERTDHRYRRGHKYRCTAP